MMNLRRLITLSCKTPILGNLTRSNCRCLSISPTTFKIFPRESQKREVYLPKHRKAITAQDLLQRMKMNSRSGALGKVLKDAGLALKSDILRTVIPMEIAELAVLEFDMIPIFEDMEILRRGKTRSMNFHVRPRPPVVTIMGHVDHGKTTLLDYLRKSSITKEEAGGITQHIGAFSVSLPDDQKITFIDTPGHAAFDTMRARGAYVTDIVILVIAADEGIKAQTLESLKHIRDASANVIVALNKIDKPNSKVKVTKNQLLGFGLHLEEFGGNVQCIEISALKGTNISKLIEAILAEAEVADLRADFESPVEGIILESKVDVKHGCVATVLVGQGELTSGTFLHSGNTWCKVRQLLDERNQEISCATPSMPVRVTGWKNVPAAGDAIVEVSSEAEAKSIIEKRTQNTGKLNAELVDFKPVTSRNLDVLREILKKKNPHIHYEVNPKLKYDSDNKMDLIIKGDVTGSVEAILQILKTYSASQISLSVLHAGVGDVSENDVTTAAPFKGSILAFNVKTPKAIQNLAEESGVTIKHYNVIYKLFEELKQTLTERLPPLRVDTEKGRAVVLQKFKLTGSRKAVVAGCSVKSGVLNKNDSFRVLRYNNVIHEGKLISIKRGVEDASSIPEGSECGLSFENYADFEQGDIIVCFSSKNVKQEIDWETGF